jgi:hypothetical protein
MRTETDTTEHEADIATAFHETRTEAGHTLLDLVNASPVLLVFLRHFGCSFCRQSLDDVSKVQDELARRGVRPVFVHLGSPERAKPYFDYYKLAEVERISNPDGSFYTHPIFALPRVSLPRLIFQPAVWKGWLQGALRDHGIGMIREDAMQMPGVFFLRGPKIIHTYRFRTIADRPDYLRLVD